MIPVLKRLAANKTALTGAIISVLVAFAVIFGPMISPYDGDAMDVMAMLAPPSLAHPFGTDTMGRDVLTRVLYGARLSLLISISGVGIAAVLGSMIGLFIAYRPGFVSNVLMKASDLLFSFPSFVLALFLMVVLGYGVFNVALAIALIYLPIFVRLARNLAQLIVMEPWVQAAKLFGQPTHSILLRELLPNAVSPLLVQATIGVAFGIVIEAGVSFLGLGVQPPAPSLGLVMSDGREYFNTAPWVLTMTGLAISIALLGLNLLGDGLRDLTDPKLKERLS
ncbi:peptide/nickel transport system permease protein [Azospirillum sp. OGB3]|uniref:ABC transporter permease n=1 Tax=Azospirillum sp. OGB3 TaxID=2587012 RepID=UPI001606754A|nr:ABC transporter permease [Azospirillum sp. OGB3]MBB3265792.1 peptide/nickel transport system permease protein [Azospirillum sp. OGB3]